ncbi:MAG: UDP-3-O-(3-hydroxymyristoyl)glucosamine N-acyltransferase [Rubrimonas sp.]|uniref:UDP-3-O-(3-hydroxymyristoyl)glucosamine N-acyltransferase n=1 Tax=Rubrimonas sp. TaxID=2036015 RepID=UPI002FDDA81A
MAFSIAEIAASLQATAEGDTALRVVRPAHPAEAGPDDLALAMDDAHVALLGAGAARAAVLREGTDWRALGLGAAILVARPRYALAGLTQSFAPPRAAPPGVHPLACVDPSAQIEAGAAIGPFCAVGAGARIGAGCVLLSHVAVGAGVVIGPDGLIHPGARIGAGVRIGARVIVQPNAVIGSDGFSFVTPSPGSVESVAATGRVAEDARNMRLARIHSLGGVEIGDDVEIGAGTTVDAGTVSPTRIGSGTKIDNLAQIGHNVRIGSNCLICAQVGVAGSARIGDRVVLGGQSGVADHVAVGSDVVAGARSGIAGDVADRSVVLGAPALPRAEALAIVLETRRLPRLARTVAELKKRLSAAEPKG